MPATESIPIYHTHPHDPNHKPPLKRIVLRDVIDLALWAGQLLLQHGAETERIEETVHRLGTALGADWMDILISPNAIIATTISGDEFRTKVRRVAVLGVNMTVIAEINDLSRRVEAGQLDRFGVRSELMRISTLKPVYNRWLVVIMVGLACAPLPPLFGGGWAAFALGWGASSAATFVRQELIRRYFNPLVIVTITSFTAAMIASLGYRFQWTATPSEALAASVLLLVPGVHLINAAEDMLKGHMVTGVIRGVLGAVISAAIGLGLLTAMRIVGIFSL